MKRAVLLDNHDSFTWNLADLLLAAAARTGLAFELDVVRNTDANVRALERQLPDALVLSPGPNAPADAGLLLPLLGAIIGRLPILGVCLGHQALAVALGGRVAVADVPIHGEAWPIFHDGAHLFSRLPQGFLAMRYHSLHVPRSGLPPDLAVTAWLADGTVMALRDRQRRLETVQFHPESIGTPLGPQWAEAAVHWLVAAPASE